MLTVAALKEWALDVQTHKQESMKESAMREARRK